LAPLREAVDFFTASKLHVCATRGIPWKQVKSSGEAGNLPRGGSVQRTNQGEKWEECT